MKKHLPLIGIGIVFVVLLVILFMQPPTKGNSPADSKTIYDGINNTGSCNVATIPISGYLATEESSDTPVSSWDISQAIRNINFQGKIALVVFMDSDGGESEAAGEISAALDSVPVPTVTYVRGDALSGGYWIAASTGHITALPTSLIGNIGVNSSFLDETNYDANQGYTYEQITSGPYKDAGNTDTPLSNADREFLQGVNSDLFSIFSDIVMKGRGLSAEQFASVADGKFYVASKAMSLGLIDEIGDIDQVENYLSTKTGTGIDNIRFCPFPQY